MNDRRDHDLPVAGVDGGHQAAVDEGDLLVVGAGGVEFQNVARVRVSVKEADLCGGGGASHLEIEYFYLFLSFNILIILVILAIIVQCRSSLRSSFLAYLQQLHEKRLLRNRRIFRDLLSLARGELDAINPLGH